MAPLGFRYSTRNCVPDSPCSVVPSEAKRSTSGASASSPWRNPFFLSDGSDNGDSGSFEMDEAAEAKNKGLCYRCTSGSARAAKKVQKYTTKADFSALGECRLPAKSGSSGSD